MKADQLVVQLHSAAWDMSAEEQVLRRATPGAGAMVSFSGLVRDADDGTLVHALHLEHYAGMTERSILNIAERACQRWALLGIRIAHRVGTVSSGELIVQVVVAARHRAAAFDGAAFIMDYLKAEAPLWKKELCADGARWVGGRDSDTRRAARWESAGAGGGERSDDR